MDNPKPEKITDHPLTEAEKISLSARAEFEAQRKIAYANLRAKQAAESW